MTDPALRTMFDGPGQALHDAIERDMTEAPDPVSRRERVHRTIDAWLAAAEAAPLDDGAYDDIVQASMGGPDFTPLDSGDELLAHELDALLIGRYPSHRDAYVAYIVARAAAEAAPLDARTMTNAWAVLVAETNPNRWEPDRYNAAAFVTALLAEYAALRSPDTEETT